MGKLALALAAAAAVLAVSTPSLAALQDENLLTPLPAGFKIGFQARRGTMDMQEMIPAGETVEAWTIMVTVQIFHGAGNVDPDKLPQAMSQQWPTQCAGGSGLKILQTMENGYPVSIWQFVCPNNPATGKPENMWMKTISGKDALYSVQYAYRQPLTAALPAPTMQYLKRVTACDTRTDEHPCPKGM